ncbi:hypothetical protein ASPZODRAFT_78044, partial [Penicilliopsis zonata CBS 506.65]
LIKPIGLGGLNYYLMVIDDKHWIPDVYPTKIKNKVSTKVIKVFKIFKNIKGSYPIRVYLDGGLEFKEFIK